MICLRNEGKSQQLLTCGYLEVASPTRDSRLYRIPGAGGLVKVYEGGSAVMDLCVQPAEPLPDADVVLLHKLMIEGNEEGYLQQANQFAPGILVVNRATVRRLVRRMLHSLKGGTDVERKDGNVMRIMGICMQPPPHPALHLVSFHDHAQEVVSKLTRIMKWLVAVITIR